MSKNAKILGVFGFLVILFSIWYFYPHRDKTQHAEANSSASTQEELLLEGRKIGLLKSKYPGNEESVIFCGKTTVNSKKVTEHVLWELKKRLEKEGAEVDISYIDVEDLVYVNSYRDPTDFVLGITHIRDLSSFFDESMDSNLTRYTEGKSISDSKEVQLAYAIQEQLLSSLKKNAEVALTLNMGSGDEGYDGVHYRPVAITVRPHPVTATIACDYLGDKDILTKEIEALANGIMNYYR
jgi:hypothetical protein